MQLLICNMQLYRALHGYFIAGQTMSCFPLPIQQRPFYIIFWQRNIPKLPFPLISHNWRVMGLAQKWSITTAGSNTKTFENHCATCPRNSSSMYFSQARTIFFPAIINACSNMSMHFSLSSDARFHDRDYWLLWKLFSFLDKRWWEIFCSYFHVDYGLFLINLVSMQKKNMHSVISDSFKYL